MRIVAWNCNMALHRKVDALLALEPDIAVISETANPERLAAASARGWIEADPVWVGDRSFKGLGVFAFNGYSLRLDPRYAPRHRYVLPVRVGGRGRFNLLAVWAQNANAGGLRKHRPGPLRLAITRYREFLREAPAVVAGDMNNNAIWDRPGWRINHMNKVRALDALGLASAYHAIMDEAHGEETIPTHYWRDRREDGPTYHIDFVFMPRAWIGRVTHFEVGSFAGWCGNRLSDHVPIIVDVDV
jgi:exodeoxyribonuclease-3